MKVAVLIVGQSRTVSQFDKLEKHLLVPYNADVYVATWDEPYAAYVLDAFKPKKHLLVPVEEFATAKQQFWNKLEQSATEPSLLDWQFRFLNGQIEDPGQYKVLRPDNTLRMIYMNYKAVELLEGRYDCVVKVRPDTYFNEKVELPVSLDTHTLYSAANHFKDNRKNQYMSDQVFFGDQTIMVAFMSMWNDLPRFSGEKFAMLRTARRISWLSPESTFFGYAKQNCGLTVKPALFNACLARETDSELAIKEGWVVKPVRESVQIHRV